MTGSWLPKFVKQIVDPGPENDSCACYFHVKSDEIDSCACYFHVKSVFKKRIHGSYDLSHVKQGHDSPWSYHLDVIVTFLWYGTISIICRCDHHSTAKKVSLTLTAFVYFLLPREHIDTGTPWIPVYRQDGSGLCHQNNTLSCRNIEPILVFKVLLTKIAKLRWTRWCPLILRKAFDDIGSIESGTKINTSALDPNHVIREMEVGPLAP